MTILRSDNWSENVNDAFIQGGIDAGKPFYLGSNPDISNYRNAWQQINLDQGRHARDEGYGTGTIFFREMIQLRNAGYRLEGDYMIPPN